MITVDQYLGHSRPGVVIRRHREAIGTRTHHRQQITLNNPGNLPVFGNEVSCLTYGANNIDNFFDGACLADRQDHMVCSIQS